MLETLRTARGVMRSLGIYYGWQQRGRPVAMDALYAHFVKPGDLVFDVGAHVGDRIAAFRRLGAKVVAVEPQRALNFVIGMMFSRDDCVVIERVAVGRKTGDVKLMINTDNPTISTASDAFINSAKDAPGWQGQHWDKSVRVPMTTLDSLIAKHGVPAFIKIDIEGFEEEALMGLTQPVAALSFEFTTIQRDVAHRCVERCAALGFSTFNAALGESQILVHEAWMSAQEIGRWIDALPHSVNSGDLYAHA